MINDSESRNRRPPRLERARPAVYMVDSAGNSSVLLLAVLAAIALACAAAWLLWPLAEPPSTDRPDARPAASRLEDTDMEPPAAKASEDSPRESEHLPPPLLAPLPGVAISTNPPPSTPEKADRALREEQLQVAEHLAATAPHDPDAVFLLAMVHKEQGNAIEAVECCRKALALDASRAAAHDILGHFASLREEHDEAIAFSQKALSLDASLVDAASRIAQSLMHQGQFEEAIAALKQDRRPLPKNERLLGEAYLQLKGYEQAKQHFQQAVRLDPDLAKAHYGLAMAYARSGQREESKPHLERFQQLSSQGRETGRDVRRDFQPLWVTCQSVAHTHTDVGRVYQRLRNEDAAERLWRRAASIDPQNVACRFEMALLLQQRKAFAESLTFCEEMRKIQPNEPTNYLRIGLLKREMDDVKAAEQAFLRVIELKPRQPEGYLALARMYLESNVKLPEARTHAKKATQFRPSASNLFLLSMVCEANGDRAGCLDALGKARGLDPRNVEYRRFYEGLKKDR